MTRALVRLGAPLLMLASLTGCNDDFKDITAVTESRILGAHVSVTGDPERVTPRPGETADVRFELVAPRPGPDTDDLYSMFVSCTYPNRFTGIPVCQEFLELLQGVDLSDAEDADIPRIPCIGEQDIMEMGVGFVCKKGVPELTISVAEDFDGPAKLVRGVICDGGVPFFDVAEPGLFGCTNDVKPVLTHRQLPVSFDEREDNLNPDPAGFSFELNGEPWPALSPETEAALEEGTPCAFQENPRDPRLVDTLDDLRGLDPFGHEITIAVDEDVLEPTEDGRETIEVATHATAGEVLRWLTIFDDEFEVDDGKVSDTLEWTGRDIDRRDTEGTLVDFYFTARDRRGGFSVMRRTACVYSLESLID